MIQQTDSQSRRVMKSSPETHTRSLPFITCPKCEKRQKGNFWEDFEDGSSHSVCIYCGFTDYDNPVKKQKYKAKGIHDVAHYNGTYKYFKDKVVKVEILSSHGPWSIKTGVIFKVTCPWCELRMEPTSKYLLYQCRSSHRVRIQNEEDGSLYWD